RPLAERIGQIQSLLPALDLVEVADQTGVGFKDVAGVYFAIDDRLELHTLRDRISALPREERWEALARRALQEDLQREHCALTVEVLGQATAGSVGERLAVWTARNSAAVDRCVQVLGDVLAGGSAA